MNNLILGKNYTKKDLGNLFEEKGLITSREGIFSSNTLNSIILFVDLIKEGKVDEGMKKYLKHHRNRFNSKL